MSLIITGILDPMIRKAPFPYLSIDASSLRARNENPPLMYWMAFSKEKILCGCDQQTEVIRHDDKFMQKESLFRAIFLEDTHQELCHFGGLQDRAAALRDRRDKDVLISCGASDIGLRG